MTIFDTLSESERTKTEGTLHRAAKLRQDLNDHERAMVRLFERIHNQTREAAEARMVVDFPLTPELAAAYAVWKQTNRDAGHLTLAFDVGEAPIGPELP